MQESRAKELGLLSDTAWSYIERVGKKSAEFRTGVVDMQIARRVSEMAILTGLGSKYKWSQDVRYDDDYYVLSIAQAKRLRYFGVVDKELVAFDCTGLDDDYVAVYPLYEYRYNMSGVLIEQLEREHCTPTFVLKSEIRRFWLNETFIDLANAYDRACKGLNEVGVGSKDVYIED
jgi:hypothetical protein